MKQSLSQSSPADADKQALRGKLKAARRNRALDEVRWREANIQLRSELLAACPPNASLCLFAYLALPDEANLDAVIEDYRAAGARVLVPVIEKQGSMLACPFPGWGLLDRGMLGIRRPRAAKSVPVQVSLAFVPGLAFTAGGDRLGYGGGYYDRWLANHPQALRVGVCLDFQMQSTLPTQAHDVGMDLVVTNAGAIWTHRRAEFRPRLPPSC